MGYKWKPNASQRREFAERMRDPEEKSAYETKKAEKQLYENWKDKGTYGNKSNKFTLLNISNPKLDPLMDFFNDEINFNNILKGDRNITITFKLKENKGNPVDQKFTVTAKICNQLIPLNPCV